MDSHKLGHLLLDGPRLDVRLSAFTPVAGVKAMPLYDADAPFSPDPQPVGQYLELQPDGLADGAGC